MAGIQVWIKTLYVFDPQNNYNPLNANGELVNINYMIQNQNEFKEMIKLTRIILNLTYYQMIKLSFGIGIFLGLKIHL